MTALREHPVEVAAGALVVAVAAAFLAYAAQFAGATGGEGYMLSASFRSAEGVRVGTDVRLAGVRIGSVTDLALDPHTYRAETTFTVDAALRLPEDSAVAVASEGLLGGTYLEVLPGGSPFELEPGAEIEDTQSAVSLVTLLLRFVTGSEE